MVKRVSTYTAFGAFEYFRVYFFFQNPTLRKKKIYRGTFSPLITKLIEMSDMRGVLFLSDLKGIFLHKKFLKYALNKDFRPTHQKMEAHKK